MLGVTRVSGDAFRRSFFAELVGDKPTARVGNYTLARNGSVSVGYSQELLYFATDKDLLMAYLGRLSGKAAPRLQESVAYTLPTRSNSAQEISTFLNFSAANVVRSRLGQRGLPRLLSPLVDALDTLSQYAGGLNTTPRGLTTASAQVVNMAGKDTPLARILTHQTTFGVASVIPAGIELVEARACAPESGAYLGRWLTRLDLFELFGFLTDSQLASHLERSSAYLGDECARVALSGATAASGGASEDVLGALNHMVTYQRVTDRAAAEAALPGYAASLNKALAGLGESLASTSFQVLLNKDGALRDTGAPSGAVQGLSAADRSLQDLTGQIGKLKLVYGFRGDYLVTAWSDEALRTTLNTGLPTLSSDAGFLAAQLPQTGAGWTFGRNLPELSVADFVREADAEKAAAAVPFSELSDAEKAERLDMTPEGYAELTDEEKDELAELETLLSEDGASPSEKIGRVTADFHNRYDGMTSEPYAATWCWANPACSTAGNPPAWIRPSPPPEVDNGR